MTREADLAHADLIQAAAMLHAATEARLTPASLAAMASALETAQAAHERLRRALNGEP